MNRSEIRPQWQSLEELDSIERQSQELGLPVDEFAPGADTLEVRSGVDRRNFLGMLGASMALTGTVATGCIRKPDEKILPYVKRPEDLIPGESRYFATSLQVVGQVYGVLVKSFDGRPIKVEGNPDHPASLGATNHFGQAEVLSIYDPDRLTKPVQDSKPIELEAARQSLSQLAAEFKKTGGRGLGILTDWVASPSYQGLLGKLNGALPEARFYSSAESRSVAELSAMGLLGLPNGRVRYSLADAKVIVALDADPFGLEGETVRLTREFAEGRKLAGGRLNMNRLYAVESSFSVTGSIADNRLMVPPLAIQEFVVELARELDRRGVSIGGQGSGLAARLGQTNIATQHSKWIKAVTEDLLTNPGQSVVIPGEKQPDWVYALTIAVNAALGNVGKTVEFYPDGSAVKLGYSDQLAQDIKAGSVKSLIIVGGNPAYSLPGDVGFEDLLTRVDKSIYLGFEANETSAAVKFAIPMAHGLEAWGDTVTIDGTVAVRQPIIAPIFPALSEIEFLAVLAGESETNGYSIVRQNFRNQSKSGDSDAAWHAALISGVAPYKSFEKISTGLSYAQLEVALRKQLNTEEASADSLDVVFANDYRVYDGRFANNAWLQELPDPLTKLTWDNAILLGPSTAAKLGLKTGDSVELNVGGGTAKGAVLVQPGVAKGTAVFSLGYGRRKVGRVGTGTGFDTAALRSYRSPFLARGGKIRATGETYVLARTQLHNSMEGRPIVREATLAAYTAQPNFVDKYELIAKDKQKTLLWTEPNVTTGQQWGMTIDLNSCTGCSSCIIACQAENNVAIVGKKEVDRHRYMAWIRVDAYFTGTADDPQAVMQPVNCMHCETAPCENVCPVGATVHSPEGMNDMAYNRCIGTRYCANNCPYKVRKFNYFNFSKRQDEMNPLIAMQQNPNVTVRFRGVIEKCTYCVQRVNKARIDAKVNGNGIIPEGTVQTACQQACPAGAIEFGDINNTSSQVAHNKSEPRNYGLLGELNTRPRTTYLAKVRNPHASLV
jgi:Fe-S-cluster-containing dehydrogenase component